MYVVCDDEIFNGIKYYFVVLQKFWDDVGNSIVSVYDCVGNCFYEVN